MNYYAPFMQPYANYSTNSQNGFIGQNNANYGYNSIQPSIQQQVLPNTSGLIWVDNEQQVNEYLVAPNNVVPIFHKTEPLIYIKSSDGAGMIKVEKYKMTKFVETPQKPPAAFENDGNNYVTQDAITAINGKLNDLAARCDVLEQYRNENAQETPKTTIKKTKGIEENGKSDI